MDLQTKVSFRLTTNRVMENYTPNGRFIGTHEYDTSVKNLSEFRNFVTNFAKAARFGRLDVDKVTGKPPVALVELLNKTTEISR